MQELIFTGEVEKGEGIAASLGCPTANLSIEHGGIIPGLGIYTGLTEYEGKAYPSLIVITDGRTGSELRLEVHMIDECFGNLEGETLTVHIYEKLRDSVPWESDEKIKDMFADDLAKAKAWFGRNPEKQSL